MTPAQRRSVRGARVVAVRRRGKHQLIDLDDGRVLHAHFRMSGAWKVGPDARESRYPRATLGLDDGSVIVLDDPRALSSIVLVAAGADSIASLGPDADDPSVGAAWFVDRLSKRKSAIKVVLLDQTLLSGIGNIYASESLWHSRLDPRRPANDLTPPEVHCLLKSIRAVLKRASGARYDGDGRFDVYDREGEKCRRCKSIIERIPQAGRSTYSCPRCQQ